jgi:hypothetical protein
VATDNDLFYEKADRSLRNLFERAKAAQELHFAMALGPEFRGAQDHGWSTAHESVQAYDEFQAHLTAMKESTPIFVRILLAFYNHVAEGAGFYEIPKSLLLTIGGHGNNFMPFDGLVERHRLTGERMAPNANRIIKDLIGHAAELGLAELAEVFRDAFDADVRNAVAHADYIIRREGLLLRRRKGGTPRLIRWNEFWPLIDRGLNLFHFIRQITSEYVHSYENPKTIRARLADEPEQEWTIYCDPSTRQFGFISGNAPPPGFDAQGQNSTASLGLPPG